MAEHPTSQLIEATDVSWPCWCWNEHYPTGTRAWCPACSEWCYPHALCIRGEASTLAEEYRLLSVERMEMLEWMREAEAALESEGIGPLLPQKWREQWTDEDSSQPGETSSRKSKPPGVDAR